MKTIKKIIQRSIEIVMLPVFFVGISFAIIAIFVADDTKGRTQTEGFLRAIERWFYS